MPRTLDPELVRWTRERRQVWGVIGGAIVVLTVAYLFLRVPVLVALGRAAGGSASAAVTLGWALTAVPTAVAVSYPASIRPRLGRAGRRLATVALIALFMPAMALGPGRFSGFESVRREAREHAPLVAEPLVSGVSAGLWGNLVAGLLALAVLVKARPGLVLLPVFISVGALAIAVESAPAALPEPRFRAERYLAAGTLWGNVLRPVAIEERKGCAGATADPATDGPLEARGCRRLVRALVDARQADALLAASIVEMPSREDALAAAQRIVLEAAPRPLARAGEAPLAVDGREPARVLQVRRYLLIAAAVLRPGEAPPDGAAVRLAIDGLRTAIAEDLPRG